MNTVDSRFYRKLVGTLFAVLVVIVLVSVACLLLVPSMMGIVAIVGGASVAAIVTALSHVRMRMIFSSLNSRSARTLKQLEITKSGVSNALGKMRTDLEAQRWAEQLSLVDQLLAKVTDVEREVIANDSFSVSRSDELVNLVIAEIRTSRDEIVRGVESGFSSLSSSDRLREERSQTARSEILDAVVSNASATESLSKFTQTVRKYLVHSEELLRSLTKSEYEAHKEQAQSMAATVRGLDSLYELVSSVNGRAGAIDDKIDSGFQAVDYKMDGIEASYHSDLALIRKAIDRVRDRVEESARVIAENAELNALAVEEQFDLVSKNLPSGTETLETLSALTALAEETRETHRLSSIERSKASAQVVDSINRALEVKIARVEQGVALESENIVNRLTSGIEDLGGRNDNLERTAQDHFNALQSKLQQLRVGIEELPKDVSDYSALLDEYGLPSTRSPRIGGWAVTVPAIGRLVREIETRSEVENVLDVGSGTSTVWSALAMRKRGYGKVFALEHEPIYAEQLRTILDELELTEWAEVILAPLAPWTPHLGYKIESERLPDQWYSTYDISDQEFDVVFVDGPPGQFQKYSRLPALESLVEQLRLNCLVIIDDTIRVEERDTVNEWLNQSFSGRKLIVDAQLSKSTALRLVDERKA